MITFNQGYFESPVYVRGRIRSTKERWTLSAPNVRNAHSASSPSFDNLAAPTHKIKTCRPFHNVLGRSCPSISQDQDWLPLFSEFWFSSVQFILILFQVWLGPRPSDACPLLTFQCGRLYLDPFLRVTNTSVRPQGLRSPRLGRVTSSCSDYLHGDGRTCLFPSTGGDWWTTCDDESCKKGRKKRNQKKETKRGGMDLGR